MDEQTLLSRYAAGDRRFYLIQLSNRNLPGAILAGAIVTTERLEQAKSLSGATMPDGKKHA
jgi:hypothetical protein